MSKKNEDEKVQETTPLDETATADLDKPPETGLDNITFEEEDGEGITLSLDVKVKRLREKLKKTETEKGEYLAGWQRAKADLINARKRDDEEKREFVKYANEAFIEELLPVLDSFTMAFSNKEAWEKVDKNWRMGVEYIYAQLLGVLGQNNLKPIDPKGEKFDPNKHISIESVPVKEKAQDGVITEVVQKGYELNGKILRAPKVKVGSTRLNFSET